ncbi:MAG: SAM-dependent methyltransferase [Candidatus Margulisbacteria bacterium]|nr:SAM-dependent methyltransferase [Candidatus Margulisiibacteriota bacterium]
MIFVTDDGSHSLHVPELNEHYHSTHGAIQESQHIYIENGLNYLQKQTLNILEIGFGTGLNVLLTALHAGSKTIRYTTLEPYPLPDEILSKLNYPNILNANNCFTQIHTCPWEIATEIQPHFFLKKHRISLQDYYPIEPIDLIYFDAFGPTAAPDLWTQEQFQKLYNTLNPGGVLITFSAKGTVRQALTNVGFTVTKRPGPTGKTHISRAEK